jgi:HAD superfamily hydrolase (TIGR01490 family)
MTEPGAEPTRTRLRDALDGRTLLLTGVTGFVGEALLTRIVRDLPSTRVVALVRPKGSQSGRDRLAALMAKPTFDGADVEGLLADRVSALEGDLAAVPELPEGVDVVVHCAGDVSFDPPIHEAFRTNVAGTEALLERVRSATASGRAVHYLHVSTAYVSGHRRGSVPEGPVEHDVDWRAEVAAGARTAERAEDASRSPAVLRRLLREADREHRRAGPLTSAADAERRRRDWVQEQQKAAGTERARSLGWTDVYTFTKAMGERVVEEAADRHRLPVSIVRPSIIESALRYPHPGWIEGFKMAEPIIMAYGRGELPEFPAAPDSVVDIVPVDHVVNAILAVAAGPAPEPGAPAYFHVSSGQRNALTFRRLYELVREYFDAHPFDMGERGAVRLPTWRFPGSEAVEKVLVRGEKAHRLADRALGLAPRSDRVRELSRDLDRQHRRLEFLRRYMDLYRAYTQVELRFVDDHTLALHRSLHPDDLGAGGYAFDTAAVDWTEYIRDIHCPSVTEPMRQYDTVRRRRNAAGPPRPPALQPVEPGAAPVLAVFDMDGTLISSNVVETYLWLRMPELVGGQRVREVGTLLRRLPGWISAERRDRGAFLRAVYRRYEGADVHELDQLVDDVVTPHVLERVSGAALRRVREHRAAGHRTVLLTGAIRPLTRPLAPLFDVVVAADLATRSTPDGRKEASGFLSGPPLVGEGRAAWVRRYAQTEGADLSESYAYADSHSDLPLLQVVGNATAVSPDVPLFRAARAARWPVADWATDRTGSRLRMPDLRRDTSGAGLPS